MKVVELNKDQAKALYQKYDTDNNGKIDREEFFYLCLDYYQITKTKSTQILINGLFEAADENGRFNFHDGKLNFDEFYQIVSLLPKEFEDVEKDIARVVFTLIDSDNSKTISVKELHVFMKKLYDCISLESAQRSLTVFDDNNNGVLEFEEFFNCLMKM